MSHEHKLPHICSNCGKAGATIWCENDQCKLCQSCDEEAHKTKLTAGHVRKPLSEALIGIQKCPLHPDHVVQYYCQKCHLPICLECKVKGNHSKGDTAKHALIDISKAYETALGSMSKPNPSFVTRENILNEQIRIANEKIDEIEEMEKQIEAEINRIAAKAIEESRQQTTKMALIAKSAKFDLLRKLNELNVEKEIINAQKENSEPLRFLQAFYRNQCIEREFADNADLPEPASNIDAKLIVSGRIDVGPSQQSDNKVQSRGIEEINDDDSSLTESIENDDDETEPHITSLSRMAKRKRNKYNAAGIKLDFQPFEGSTIITDPELATRLYLCFPFKGQPITHRMYYSEEDGRNVSKIHKIIDGHGITAILVKSGENVFGGFASSKWNSDGVKFGNSSSSFIFQLNKDAFIPNRGQSEEPICLYATEDTLTFGKFDLALIGSLDKCKSTIENSYGVGFTYGSTKAQTFLAGAPEFRADIVEVWGFFSSA